jgi:hypothetical protein
VKLVRQSATVELGARYPRVVAQQGTAPPQYPDLDEEDEGEDEGEDEEEDEEEDEGEDEEEDEGMDDAKR